MRMTESRLRRVIRSVIRETSSDYRLSLDFSQKVESMIDEVKPGFIRDCRELGIFEESDLDDYKVHDFLKKYLGEVVHLMGEEAAKRRFKDNSKYATQAFKRYLKM